MPTSRKNIYLTGFMGAGKTTVGRGLALLTGRRFVDADEEIEKAAGLKVAGIFSRHGEAHFRHLETRILARLSASSGLVVATGGGAVLSRDNRELFRRGLWFFLDVPFAVLIKRIRAASHRPLAAAGDDALLRLWLKRRPLYAMAPAVIRCGSDAPDAVCRALLRDLRRGGRL